MKKGLFVYLVLLISVAQAQDHLTNLKKLNKLHEAEKNIVLFNNGSNAIPVKELSDLNIASVHVNYSEFGVFDSLANKYCKVTGLTADTLKDAAGYYALHDRLKLYNMVIVTLSDRSPFNNSLRNLIKDIESYTQVVVVLTGPGKNLGYLDQIKSPVIWYKNDTPEGASIAAQLIFGGIAVPNRLTENFSKKFIKGSGYTATKIRLGYSLPEAVMVNADKLNKIDSIVAAGIASHSAPAVVVLVAKNGEVIFNKAYGKHTYNGNEVTKLTDIFDMASITKVTATTPSIMHLYEQHTLGLDSPISKYVALLRNIPDKKDVTVREALLHEAGFTPYIKFYEKLKQQDLSADSSAAYPTKVADHYYLRANYFNEVMWPVTLASSGNTRGKFVYSDLSMYMMKEVFETVSHQKLNEYVLSSLYRPLGMQASGYLPRNRFNISRIVPTTENDNWFRNMLVQGYVNDPGAAMAGGVEGHAGLFSNANDLAIYYQMLLNKGTYGGSRYFDSTTVDLFTSRQSKTSWRGLGFDRTNKSSATDKRSELAFGHSGYTGTYVWVDPKYNLVYICLTNRVYPDDGKTYGPAKVNIRSLVLDACYDAITDNEKKEIHK
ncbi:serine hydrolase [Mucilaginibacter sp. PAMB04168]|uniref:serine hydrolase domain-containing protein n=1 Tax=Mucilaginibacter sp. PAMB04168 TaxID=3138567 RepID=UPI0031F70DC5